MHGRKSHFRTVSYNNKNGEEGASTRKAVRFINEYFPKHYKPYADLLVAIWRHGTVHNFAPSQFYAVQGNKKTIIKWTSNRSNAKHNRAVNLRTFNKKNSLNIIYLSINIFQLADDLLYAFDRLIEKIDGQSSFANGCLRRLNRLFKMKNCMSLKRIGNTKKGQLKNQILTAKSSTIGTIDDHLQVEYY